MDDDDIFIARRVSSFRRWFFAWPVGDARAGCWRHLLVNAASDRLDGGLAVQNPAVEWNNVASDR